PAVRNAFILWALSEAEKPTGDLHTTAYRRALQDLNQVADSYCLALMANTALNRSDADSRRLLRQLSTLQQADGALPAPATTITNSRGPEAIAETVALATAAWLQGGPEFMAEAQRGLQYLLRRRLAQGTFGTTQATVLTLRALALAPATPAALPASVAIQVGAETRVVPIVSDGPTTTTFTITDDRDRLAVQLLDASPTPIAWTLTTEYRTERPKSAELVSLKFSVRTPQREVPHGAMAPIQIRLENTDAQETGMVTVHVGLPAGLQLPTDAELLNTARDQGQFDHWELRSRELILYLRGMRAKEIREWTIDTKAEFEGEYRGPASHAYHYYHPQNHVWHDPLQIRIGQRK
ncbi:MAG: hypothetical protein ACRCZF_25400, partial [Gemmataceae bacterium]